MHSQFAFKPWEKCLVCGGPPLVTLTVFGEEKEMWKKDPMLRVLMTTDPLQYQQMRLVTKSGPYLRISRTIACLQCAPAAEKAAAHHPSWVFCDIDRGPAVLPIQVGYGS
jgi:hypothetical protein